LSNFAQGQYGPVALEDINGRPLVGATVQVPNGYTATVINANLTITGPPADGVAFTPTFQGFQQPTQTVTVLPLSADVVALNGIAVPKWQPATAYVLGQTVLNPTGELVNALAAHTSGVTFTAANWSPPSSATYAPIGATRQALAAAILARMSRSDGEKTSLYAGTAPVFSVAGASAITSGVLRAPRHLTVGGTVVPVDDDPNFRYLNTPYMNYGGTYPDSLFARSPLLIGGGAQAASWYPRISFYYDGQTFEWFGKAFNATESMRFRIDGKLVTLDLSPVASGLSAGNFYWFKVDLGSAAMRLIEIDFGAAPSFGGIVVEPTASISRGPAPALRMACLTDSVGAGAGSYSRIASWAGAFAELMGSDASMYNAGIGGTGYAAGAGVNDFITRVPDIVAANPDILIVEGGENDGSQTPAQLQALATTLLQALVAQLPKCLIFVIGSYSSTTPTSAKMGHETALRAAAAATGTYFISWVDPSDATASGSGVPAWAASTGYTSGDVVTSPTGVPQVCFSGHTSSASFDQTKFKPTAIFFGTGKIGATTGDGNTDVMVSTDGTHPSPRGCIALGRATYYGVRRHLRAIASTGVNGIAH
jgi:lysophospholipase L1-like esterase